jgi:hypothetical protein
MVKGKSKGKRQKAKSKSVSLRDVRAYATFAICFLPFAF